MMLLVFPLEWRRGERWNKIDCELVIVEIIYISEVPCKILLFITCLCLLASGMEMLITPRGLFFWYVMCMKQIFVERMTKEEKIVKEKGYSIWRSFLIVWLTFWNVEKYQVFLLWLLPLFWPVKYAAVLLREHRKAQEGRCVSPCILSRADLVQVCHCFYR